MLRGAIAAIVLLLAGSAWAGSPAVLRVSAIPDEAPSELLRKYEPLVRYLSREVGIPVKFIPVVDYAATVAALAARKLEMVWFGGFTHVQARRRTGDAFAIVMRKEDAAFHSKFVARVGSGIRSLRDLKGKTFAFGSVGSTSGHLMPRHFLLKSGVVPERDFRRFSYSGAHDATVKWVEAGRVDAGALNEAVWEKLVRDRKVDVRKVRVFWTTPPYVDYNWTVRGDLDREIVSKLVRAFLKLDPKNPEHRRLLALQRASGYILAVEDDFKGIEAAARAAGLLK
ncbi:MAG: putative selenate ABC transporter substrate-binding protein [Nitrospinota bacterium]